jgi:type IV secretion system protein VirD4
MDVLANLFFSQAMNELCYYADTKCSDSTLPVPVRFILDDFATNCKIDEFPRMISSIRSRGISTILMIQAESQLTASYGDEGRTIISNCDTYVYMGGSDLETAKAVSVKLDVPIKKVLNLPIGTCIIFRRGEQSRTASIINLSEYEKQIGFKAAPITRKTSKEPKSLTDKLRGKMVSPVKEEKCTVYIGHMKAKAV